MWQKLVGRALVAVLTTLVAGCSLVQPAARSDASTAHRLRPDLNLDTVKRLEVNLRNAYGELEKIDPQQLKSGQHVQLLTGKQPNRDYSEGLAISSTMIAGTVKVIDGDSVVLCDAIMIEERRIPNGVPIVQKVPYFNRLFKNSGTGRIAAALIPGEVTIERSDILQASELTEDSFQSIRQNGRHERIGVDFDFNVADSGDATPQQ